MPVVDKKGYSEITPIKQEDLGHFLRYHFEVAGRVISKPTSPWNKYYLYIDANAGDGENQAGCIGSPLVFSRFKFRLSVPYKAFFIDNSPANIERLKEKLPDEKEIICKDNRIAIPLIVAEHIPQHDKTIGLLYTDPNGVPDKDLIKIASGLLPRVDILIRYNTMGAKRSFHLGEPRLCDFMDSTNKECWLIKNLCSNDRWMWTFIFGTNYVNFKAWEKQGFYRIDSKEGKHILELCSHKKSEANNNQQLSLFDEPTEKKTTETTSTLPNSRQ